MSRTLMLLACLLLSIAACGPRRPPEPPAPPTVRPIQPGHSVGPVALGMRRVEVLDLLGAPHRERTVEDDLQRGMLYQGDGWSLYVGCFAFDGPAAPVSDDEVVFLKLDVADANLSLPLAGFQAAPFSTLTAPLRDELIAAWPPGPPPRAHPTAPGLDLDYPTKGIRVRYAPEHRALGTIEIYEAEPLLNQQAEGYLELVPGERIAGIRLGAPLDEVTAIHGQPLVFRGQYSHYPNHFEMDLFWHDARAAVENNTVARVLVDSSYLGLSPDGMGVGTPLESVIRTLGFPTKRGELEDYGQPYVEWGQHGIGVTFDLETRLVRGIHIFPVASSPADWTAPAPGQ